MPIYEYECNNKDCKKYQVTKSEIQSHNSPLPICEECSKEMQKIVSQCSFQLIGNSWARDGYSTKENKKALRKQGKLHEHINKF